MLLPMHASDHAGPCEALNPRPTFPAAPTGAPDKDVCQGTCPNLQGRRLRTLLSSLLPEYRCRTSSAAGDVNCNFLLLRPQFPTKFCWSCPKFVTTAPCTSPPGYDVWLGNVRGNSLSRSHKWLTPDDPRFWEWSYGEMAKVCTAASVHTLQPRPLSASRRV